jgi:hypothetical protein
LGQVLGRQFISGEPVYLEELVFNHIIDWLQMGKYPVLSATIGGRFTRSFDCAAQIVVFESYNPIIR